METRSVNLELRDLDDDAPRRLQGTAVVYNELADIGEFQERIKPGALADVLTNEANIVLLYEHDRRALLASTRNGTLTLTDTPQGLAFTAEVADTTAGNDVLSLTRSGELRGMSMGFQVAPGGQQFTRNAAGRLVRDISKFERMPEITITIAPAYTGTGLAQRSVDPQAIAEAQRLNNQPTMTDRSMIVRRLIAAA